jgi:very-short-patch-repair endonuclease
MLYFASTSLFFSPQPRIPPTPLSKGGTIQLPMMTASKTNMITTGFHLPYNPDLVERARQLRKNQTPAEKKLWYGYLCSFPQRVLRQRPIDNYIVDFYCPSTKLVIEVDGGGHFSDDAKEYDEHRTHVLEGYGLRVLRFTNDDILRGFGGVCELIENFTRSSSQNETEPPRGAS